MTTQKTIIRILIVSGDAEWVEDTKDRSAVGPGEPYVCPKGKVSETFRGTPEELAKSFARALAMVVGEKLGVPLGDLIGAAISKGVDSP